MTGNLWSTYSVWACIRQAPSVIVCRCASQWIHTTHIFFCLRRLFIIQCHPPLHGVTLHCHCTHIYPKPNSGNSSEQFLGMEVTLATPTVFDCWAMFQWFMALSYTSSTPDFSSSSGLFLAASPSQRKVKKMERKKKKSVTSRTKTRGAAQHHSKW